MGIQDDLQKLPRSWASEFNPDMRIDRHDDYAVYVIAISHHGDIGISTDREEITVFGLSGHAHFTSGTNEVAEIAGMEGESKTLLKGLLDGSTFAYGKFSKGGLALGGGYGDMRGTEFWVRGMHRVRGDYVIVRRIGQDEVRMPASALRNQEPQKQGSTLARR